MAQTNKQRQKNYRDNKNYNFILTVLKYLQSTGYGDFTVNQIIDLSETKEKKNESVQNKITRRK